jgi:type VI secretion system protein ImpL
MFTAKGWRDYTQNEIDELVDLACRGDWVTGYMQSTDQTQVVTPDHEEQSTLDAELATNLRQELRGLYFTDYAEHWFKFLEQTSVIPFNSLEDAAEKMLLLARNDGPIAELLQVVSQNITLAENKGNALAAAMPGNRIPELEAPLHDLRKLTTAGDKMSTSLLINQYLLSLTAAQSEIEQLAATIDVQQECFQYTADILGGNGAGNSDLYKCWLSTKSLLNGIEARTRKVAEQVLNNPIQQAWKMAVQETQTYLQNQWTSTVMVHYKRKISGKFPFSTDGSDASLNDVADFFRLNNGVIWNFTEDQLKPFLRKKRSQWTEKSWMGIGLNFTPSLLRSLNQASRISSGMFRQGQSHPDVRFSIYPIPCRGVRMVQFESNGQELIYQNEPQEWKQFKWPGDDQMPSAIIGGISSGNHSLQKLDFTGDWSLFHLLEEATVSRDSDDYLVAWDLTGGKDQSLTIQLKIRPDRQSNIFANGLFSDFRLPTTIF